jgi:ABC-type glycerol-3-phosphate transport system permease component
MTIPKDLDEAAKIDGASSVRIFWNVLLPLAKPALATVAIFSFIEHWNEFIGPLIFLNSPEKFTVSVGLRHFTASPFENNEPREAILMAASLIVALPPLILFFMAQKYFVQGIVTTGLKG